MENTQNTEETSESTQDQQKPANILLGTISYNDDTAYEEFLKKMDVNQAVFVLVAAANYSQARGAFSLPEGELVNTAIRTIKKSSTAESSEVEKENESVKK